MLIENSRFDNNEDGFDTNSQNGDEPSPQNGACPAGVKPPVAGAPSCWVLTHNLFDHNNNPNVPAAGSAAAGPVGTGMSLSGGRNDTVIDNTFEDNGAWGQITIPYLDSGKPCTGGIIGALGSGSCLFDESGDAVLDNTFADNGFFGNPSNGDFALTNFDPGPTDCFSGNAEQGGGLVTTTPANLEQTYPTCNGQTVAASDSAAGSLHERIAMRRPGFAGGWREAPVPADGPLSAAVEGRHASAAEAPRDDAEPVRGRPRQSMVPSEARMKLVRRLVLVLTATAVLLAAGAAVASARVLIVTQRHVSYPHYTSIQAAVNAAHRGDWILISPGVYTGSVRISTPDLHLRGMNRNTVILDGRHHVGNGIVIKSGGVWVENLTVRNFDRRTREDSADGNEVWWGVGSGRKIVVRGWWGQYLTAYDTGLLGGYGLYASHSVDGFFKHVYASGFNDSGLYVGGCRDCEALVQDALVERNALGWSSTNAGGHLVVEDSTFRDNSVGVAPDSEPDDDLPPPQDGACDSASNRAMLPTFTSTQINRCTIFRNNLIEDNGNISTPANSDILNAPWGEGVVLGGDYADLIEDNTIRDNPTFGVLVLERPDPFPPTSNTVYFQSSGNRVSDNRRHG